MNLLQVEELKAGYRKKNILNGISMELNEGQIVGILGPNGCGKSTMIKAICKGIPYQGKISMCGQDIKEMSEREVAKICSYVPQQSGLSIDITALDVVLMGYYPYVGLLEKTDRKMQDNAKQILAHVGLEKEMYSNYMELSEGQKRLCILARSLVSDAKLLLLDEPDASLDFGIRNRILEIISERAFDKKTGILLSMHDTDLALANCDTIYLMQNGSFIHNIRPKTDSTLEMEEKLKELYGTVKLLEYFGDNETRRLVMVQAMWR